MKKKILLMFPSWKDKGGVSSFCRILMDNLSSSFDAEHLQIANRPGNHNPIRKISFFFQDIFSIRKTLRKNKYDVVHLNPSFKILSLLRDSFYLEFIYRFYCKNILVMFHGWDSELAKKVENKSCYKKVFKNIYKKAAILLVLCNQFKQQLVNIGIPPQKIKIITTMYQKNLAFPKVENEGIQKKIVIFFMSRLVRSKGAHITAETGRLLIENGYKDFSMIIAGDGPQLEEIRSYIAKNSLGKYITAPGYITGEKKQKIISRSDIFIYPSFYGEGCPVALIEAIGAGLAVISTPVAAIPDIIENGVNGFIIGSKDPKEFFTAVVKLMEDRELLNKIKDRNKKKAATKYEAKVITRKIDLMYESLSNK